jgi:hypothetical protein
MFIDKVGKFRILIRMAEMVKAMDGSGGAQWISYIYGIYHLM